MAEAGIHNKPLQGKWLIDPDTGELSDDVAKYAKPVEGYGRVWDCEAAGQIEEPRTYALNMWNEAMTAVLNPIGVPSTALPSVEDVVSGEADNSTTVGGSYYLCIAPEVFFGSTANVKSRSDEYVKAIETTPSRPGHDVRVPGAGGYDRIADASVVVDVLENHWTPFFENIAGRYGLGEETLRREFEAV